MALEEAFNEQGNAKGEALVVTQDNLDALLTFASMQFHNVLLAEAEYYLRKHPKGKLDPEDLVQETYASILRSFTEGECSRVEFESIGSIRNYLFVVLGRVTSNTIRYYSTDKRKVAKEIGTVGVSHASHYSYQSHKYTSAFLDAYDNAQATACSTHSSHSLYYFLQLRNEGFSNERIATIMGCSERTVERALRKAKDALQIV